jgi:hypothetical protein
MLGARSMCTFAIYPVREQIMPIATVDELAERRGAAVLLEVLRSEGARYVFDNPGTTELPLIDALVAKALQKWFNMRCMPFFATRRFILRQSAWPQIGNLQQVHHVTLTLIDGCGIRLGTLKRKKRLQTHIC